ncbi:DNA polymerase III subunit gamma/tau [Candidatus Peregrinibacteria bacterium]|nr:DNA polymerase III subunit gamma/tau [Candidatus Peregrinibacteria bacterium]
MSLYLKYRPQNFASLVGQDHAKKTIQSALKSNSLSHAYLFCGPRGTGKTSLARILAKGLNCKNPVGDMEPCNKCEICTSINAGKLVDLIEIDAASNRGIDEIRELREKIVFAPSQAKTKVYIIDEVHMLTKEAFNALLKTLEEPPAHAYFVLATTEAHKIPETIVSRCQQFSFSRISISDTSHRLQEIADNEGASYEKEALDLIAKLSAGGLRDAIGLLEQMMTTGEVTQERVSERLGLTGSEHLEKFFKYLLERKPLKAIELLNQIKVKGKSIPQFLQELISHFRGHMLINLGNSQDTRIILGFIEIFIEARRQIDLSPIPELPIEVAVIKACEFNSDESEEAEKKPEVKVKIETIEKKKEEKTAKMKESETMPPASDRGELQIEQIKKDWQRVLEAIDTPFIKMSLTDGEPVRYESGILTIAFKSNTFMDKITNAANQAVVQKAFEKVLGNRLSLNLEVKKMELSPLTKKTNKEAEKKPSAVEMAAEVFGIKKS